MKQEKAWLTTQLQQAIDEKTSATQLTEARMKTELQSAVAEKNNELNLLKAQLEANKESQELIIAKTTSSITKERDEFKNQVERITLEKTIERLSQYSMRSVGS